MNYCENCGRLNDVSCVRCPHCKSKKLRAPQHGDFVYLTDADAFELPLIETALRASGIEFITREDASSLLGVSFSGKRLYRIDCLYELLQSARETLDNVTSCPTEDPEA